MSKKQYTQSPQVDQQTGRVYGTEITIESDLFRLKLADAQKNIAIDDSGQIELEKVPHTHFWRTYDSDGKKLIHCAPVAGHFHEVKYEEDPNGGPVKIISVSGPLRMGLKKERGQLKSVPVPVNPDLEDNHTHEVEYLRSHKVVARSMNVKAIQLIGEEANKTTAPNGIIG